MKGTDCRGRCLNRAAQSGRAEPSGRGPALRGSDAVLAATWWVSLESSYLGGYARGLRAERFQSPSSITSLPAHVEGVVLVAVSP